MPRPNFCGYASVDNAVEIIHYLGLCTELVKMDLKDIYRVIPVHPHDHHLGIQWRGDMFVDRSLPFGLRSAPKIFAAFSDMVAWAIHHRGVRHLLHYYLDNFLLFGQLGTLEAGQAVATAQAVFAEASITVAEHKT